MATWTLEQIVDGIMNNVINGLHGSPNTSIPKEQLRAEVTLTRNALIEKNFIENGVCKKSPGYAYAEQQINCIDVTDGDLADCCTSPNSSNIKVAEIPQVLNSSGVSAISYLGESGRNLFGWRVFYGEGSKTRPFAAGVHGRPYGELYSPKNGKQQVFIHNAPKDLTQISMTAIWLDPFAKYEYACCTVSGDLHAVVEYPASEYMIQEIMDILTQKYLQYYRQLNAPIQVNDQTDKIT